MAISGCTHPVAVVISVQGQEQFLLVVPLSPGPDEHTLKLFFMWRIETMNKTSLSCTRAVPLLHWILGTCHIVQLTIGFVGELY